MLLFVICRYSPRSIAFALSSISRSDHWTPCLWAPCDLSNPACLRSKSYLRAHFRQSGPNVASTPPLLPPRPPDSLRRHRRVDGVAAPPRGTASLCPSANPHRPHGVSDRVRIHSKSQKRPPTTSQQQSENTIKDAELRTRPSSRRSRRNECRSADQVVLLLQSLRSSSISSSSLAHVQRLRSIRRGIQAVPRDGADKRRVVAAPKPWSCSGSS